MVCPICGNKMKKTSKSVCVWWDQIDCESEWRTDTHYTCKKGHSPVLYDEYNNTWIIPETYKPTEKQIYCVSAILNRANLKAPIPTKQEHWKFIKKYIHLLQSNNIEKGFDDREIDYPIPEEECY